MNHSSQQGQRCPLCYSDRPAKMFQEKCREYLCCPDCNLLFVPPRFHLGAVAERAEYDLHQNSPQDSGYRRFLRQLFDPLVERLPAGARGLDFGSGPGPTLSVMFEESGYPMALYDPFYANQPSRLDEQFDFITASEVVEHLRQPRMELERLWSCLRPTGILGIMTQFWPEQASFEGWRYKDDRTHISFFSLASMECLAQLLGGRMLRVGRNVVLLTKPG